MAENYEIAVSYGTSTPGRANPASATTQSQPQEQTGFMRDLASATQQQQAQHKTA
jgi:hypothetical protein